MGINYGPPPIVATGISNLYDASDKHSYVGSGNDWNDIMGDFNITGLVGGGGTEPTFNTLAGGCFDFDGSDKLHLTHATKFDFAGDFAVECWMYFDQVAQEGGATVWFNTAVTDELQYAISSTSQVGMALDGTWGGFVNTGLSLANKWSCHLATRVGSDIRYYIDGVSRTSATNTTAGNDNSALKFGEQNNGNHSLDGKMANIKIYNGKGLTSTEALQNFNAQRGRFGV